MFGAPSGRPFMTLQLGHALSMPISKATREIELGKKRLKDMLP
jgi:hypothetical protein